MTRLHVPKAKPTEKDFSCLPWSEAFRCENPVKKVKELLKQQDVSLQRATNFLNFDCGVDRDKAELLINLIDNEVKLVSNDQEVNILVNIPFCFSRCLGCTNVMYEKTKEEDLYPYFYDALKKEIECVKQIVKLKYYMVKNIVFTGNLLALENEKIEEILKSLNYPFSNISVEIGSPRFVTKEKLEILKKHGIQLIIFNQLTFNTLTLRRLCRKFEFKDLYDAYKLIMFHGFKVAFEMVVGMFEEKELQLKRNLEIATELGAVNIDIYAGHCKYSTQNQTTGGGEIKEIRKLLHFAEKELISKNYIPYFLYCSDVENACFENVGFTLDGEANKFFVDKINKISTIVACGPSAESLFVKNIEKQKTEQKNTHSLSQYVFGIDEICENKMKFFEVNTLQN